MYEEWINLPTGDELERVMRDYEALGFPGAIGSTDVTHVPWDKTPASHVRYIPSMHCLCLGQPQYELSLPGSASA